MFTLSRLLLLSTCVFAVIKINEAIVFDEVFVPPGSSGYFFNNKYTPGEFYQWTVKSNSTIRMNCTVTNLPLPNVLTLQRVENEPELNYYGNINFVHDFPNQVTIKLKTQVGLGGGGFHCEFESLSDKCFCGWKNPARIVNGEETEVNEFPMMAGLIDASSAPGPQRTVFCGATILNKKQVITSASCLRNKQVEKIGVLVGDHNLLESDDTNSAQLFKIRDIKYHPNFDVNTNNNDIAIINIDGIIGFNHQVGPACLPFQNPENLFVNEQVTLLGWGSVGLTETPSPFLRKASVRVLSNESCKIYANGVDSSKLCTQHENKDSCRGDAGGPILWRDVVSKRLFLVGIIGSSGGICGNGHPAINTRISPLVDWIDQQKPGGFNYCKNP